VGGGGGERQNPLGKEFRLTWIFLNSNINGGGGRGRGWKRRSILKDRSPEGGRPSLRRGFEDWGANTLVS